MQRNLKRLIAAMALLVTLALGTAEIMSQPQSSSEQVQQLPEELIACNPASCGGGG